MAFILLIGLVLFALVGYFWWAAQAELAEHARRRAAIRRLQYQADLRIQQVAQQALQSMLDEARRQAGP